LQYFMLRVQRFPAILKTVLSDGIEGVVLMTVDGSIVSSASLNDSGEADTVVPAVASCIIANYTQGNVYDMSALLLKLENGLFGVMKAGKGFIVVAYGKTVTAGLLKGRLDALSKYFSRVFDQVR